MANVWHVPALHRGHHDRSSPQRQKAQISDKIQEQQLVSQVQRDLPLVSTETAVFASGNCLGTRQKITEVFILFS